MELIGDRTFGPWFWGNLISNSGNWLFNVTAAIVVFQLTQSAFLVGMVSVAQFGPLVLLSPLAGSLSDRLDRRRLLMVSQGVAASAAGGLAFSALAFGINGRSGALTVIVGALGIGVGQAVAAPALNALVPSLVDDVDLESAVSLTALTFNFGRALGPVGSGILLSMMGPEAAFVVNALTYIALIIALLSIPSQSGFYLSSGDRSVLGGLRYLHSDRVVLFLLVAVAATGFSVDPILTLSPSLADGLGGGPNLAVTLVSAFGVAAVPAALVAGRLQRSFGGLRVSGWGSLLCASGLAVGAVTSLGSIAVVGFGITGTGFVLAVTGFTGVLHRRTPDAMRGRIMAFWSVAFLGNRPIAAAVDGAIADLVGPRWAMALPIGMALLAWLIAARLKLAPG